jgi:hypothetical protein
VTSEHRRAGVSLEHYWAVPGPRRVAELRTRCAAGDYEELVAAVVPIARSGEAAYTAYDKHPLDEPDEWGDLASFREAAARS